MNMGYLNFGNLVVIDGIDSVGKQTQVEMMREYLISRGAKEGSDFCTVSFPRYEKSSSEMVRRYLSGEFGTNPEMIDAKMVSTFYAIDRALSFRNDEWGHVYRSGGLVIADRYTCSNVIYQGAKMITNIDNNSNFKWNAPIIHGFAKWLYEFEFNHLRIPRPDKIIYMKLSETANQKLLDERAKTEGKDIHEADNEYLKKCRIAMNIYRQIVQSSTYNLTALKGTIENTEHIFLDITSRVDTILPKETIHRMIKESLFEPADMMDELVKVPELL